MFRGTAKMTGLAAALDDGFRLVEEAVTGGIEEATIGLVEDLRDETFRALGMKASYTWASEVYPRGGVSAAAAGYVWSKWPKIIGFHSEERVHTPIGEAYAIPTGAVPKKRGGLRMTTIEVEARFDAELQLRPLKSGNLGLFLDLVRSRSRRRPQYRPATKGRLAQGRRSEQVLMFTLVRAIASRKRIDLKAAGDRWGARVPRLIEKRLERGR